MTEVTTEPTGTEGDEKSPVEEGEARVPYERFEKANKKAKEAAEKAAAAEKRVADLMAKLEEREAAGLPELEQLKKRLEQAEKRAQEAETLAEERDRQVAISRAERWVIAAAKDFVDPDDAVKNVNLTEIESAEDAERAVKRVAKAKQHLLKGDDKPLPGRVLQNGKPAAKERQGEFSDTQLAEAERLAADLRGFLK